MVIGQPPTCLLKVRQVEATKTNTPHSSWVGTAHSSYIGSIQDHWLPSLVSHMLAKSTKGLGHLDRYATQLLRNICTTAHFSYIGRAWGLLNRVDFTDELPNLFRENPHPISHMLGLRGVMAPGAFRIHEMWILRDLEDTKFTWVSFKSWSGVVCWLQPVIVYTGVCPWDSDVHRAEEQQETEGPVRPVSAHQIRHPPPPHYGCHQR